MCEHHVICFDWIFGSYSETRKKNKYCGSVNSCMSYDHNAEKLPEVVTSLRRSRAREEVALSEFQVELIQLASQLIGEHVLNAYPNIGKALNVGRANHYAEVAVARFLEAGRAALRAGANESAIVTMRPALTSRMTSGEASNPAVQSS